MKQIRSALKIKQLNNKFFRRFRKREIIFFLENIEYARNVASAFRLADAMNVDRIILTGISKTPPFGKDLQKVSRFKERAVRWEYFKESDKALEKIRKEGFKDIVIELTDESVPYTDMHYPDKVCFIVGNESYGVSGKLLDKASSSVFIPQYGDGKSLNVHIALSIVAYNSIYL